METVRSATKNIAFREYIHEYSTNKALYLQTQIKDLNIAYCAAQIRKCMRYPFKRIVHTLAASQASVSEDIREFLHKHDNNQTVHWFKISIGNDDWNPIRLDILHLLVQYICLEYEEVGKVDTRSMTHENTTLNAAAADHVDFCITLYYQYVGQDIAQISNAESTTEMKNAFVDSMLEAIPCFPDFLPLPETKDKVFSFKTLSHYLGVDVAQRRFVQQASQHPKQDSAFLIDVNEYYTSEDEEPEQSQAEMDGENMLLTAQEVLEIITEGSMQETFVEAGAHLKLAKPVPGEESDGDADDYAIDAGGSHNSDLDSLQLQGSLNTLFRGLLLDEKDCGFLSENPMMDVSDDEQTDDLEGPVMIIRRAARQLCGDAFQEYISSNSTALKLGLQYTKKHWGNRPAVAMKKFFLGYIENIRIIAQETVAERYASAEIDAIRQRTGVSLADRLVERSVIFYELIMQRITPQLIQAVQVLKTDNTQDEIYEKHKKVPTEMRSKRLYGRIRKMGRLLLTEAVEQSNLDDPKHAWYKTLKILNESLLRFFTDRSLFDITCMALWMVHPDSDKPVLPLDTLQLLKAVGHSGMPTLNTAKLGLFSWEHNKLHDMEMVSDIQTKFAESGGTDDGQIQSAAGESAHILAVIGDMHTIEADIYRLLHGQATPNLNSLKEHKDTFLSFKPSWLLYDTVEDITTDQAANYLLLTLMQLQTWTLSWLQTVQATCETQQAKRTREERDSITQALRRRLTEKAKGGTAMARSILQVCDGISQDIEEIPPQSIITLDNPLLYTAATKVVGELKNRSSIYHINKIYDEDGNEIRDAPHEFRPEQLEALTSLEAARASHSRKRQRYTDEIEHSITSIQSGIYRLALQYHGLGSDTIEECMMKYISAHLQHLPHYSNNTAFTNLFKLQMQKWLITAVSWRVFWFIGMLYNTRNGKSPFFHNTLISDFIILRDLNSEKEGNTQLQTAADIVNISQDNLRRVYQLLDTKFHDMSQLSRENYLDFQTLAADTCDLSDLNVFPFTEEEKMERETTRLDNLESYLRSQAMYLAKGKNRDSESLQTIITNYKSSPMWWSADERKDLIFNDYFTEETFTFAENTLLNITDILWQANDITKQRAYAKRQNIKTKRQMVEEEAAQREEITTSPTFEPDDTELDLGSNVRATHLWAGD